MMFQVIYYLLCTSWMFASTAQKTASGLRYLPTSIPEHLRMIVHWVVAVTNHSTQPFSSAIEVLHNNHHLIILFQSIFEPSVCTLQRSSTSLSHQKSLTRPYLATHLRKQNSVRVINTNHYRKPWPLIMLSNNSTDLQQIHNSINYNGKDILNDG